MTKKKYIDTYKTIYNVYLVVANEAVTLQDLKKKYTYYDGVEIDDAFSDGIATTAKCIDKETNRAVILVKYNHKSKIKGVNNKLDLINTAAHEATHFAMDLYSYIGEDIDPRMANENLTYNVGWATECIYNTWTKK